MSKGEATDSGLLTNVLRLLRVMELARECSDRIEDVEIRLGVCLAVREYSLEYDWSIIEST